MGTLRQQKKKGEIRGNCEAQGSSPAIYVSDTAPRYLAANEMSIEAGIWPNQMLIEEEMDGSPEVSVPALLLSVLTAFLCARVGEKKVFRFVLHAHKLNASNIQCSFKFLKPRVCKKNKKKKTDSACSVPRCAIPLVLFPIRYRYRCLQYNFGFDCFISKLTLLSEKKYMAGYFTL